jgi:ABC-type multidrug transport system fused ATPase/permease subunit
VGIGHVQTGKLDTSELVSLLLYAMLLTQPISRLADVYGKVMRTRGAAERLLILFAEQAEPDSSGKPSIGKLDGAIEFRDVTFAYAGRKTVLEHFNLSITAGETVALVGPNGSGKTTLAHLLLRFMDPAAGQIRVDGKNIQDFDTASLRQQIGLVAQHTLLLNGSVAANIAYGHPEATFEHIKKAAKAARAEEFIDNLPDGYDTIIGDQGIKLSGGQRQRLSLARTLLKDPAILILDEATSMFDPESEKDFIEECHHLLRHRTVILITHRPVSLDLADRVIQMKPHGSPSADPDNVRRR